MFYLLTCLLASLFSSAGVSSTTAAAATTAFAVSSIAFLYAATRAFKASFSNINSSIDSPSVTPTSVLLSEPLTGGLY